MSAYSWWFCVCKVSLVNRLVQEIGYFSTLKTIFSVIGLPVWLDSLSTGYDTHLWAHYPDHVTIRQIITIRSSQNFAHTKAVWFSKWALVRIKYLANGMLLNMWRPLRTQFANYLEVTWDTSMIHSVLLINKCRKLSLNCSAHGCIWFPGFDLWSG